MKTLLEELIEKHTERLKNMRETRKKEFDRMTDAESFAVDQSIWMQAEFVRDLKSLKT